MKTENSFWAFIDVFKRRVQPGFELCSHRQKSLFQKSFLALKGYFIGKFCTLYGKYRIVRPFWRQILAGYPRKKSSIYGP